MAAKTRKVVPIPAKRPEKKIGPFHGGLGISIWLNEVETAQGTRWFRSVTLAPRRYREASTGEWKDANSYRPIDLSTLELAIAEARRYLATTPLPGQAADSEDELHHEDEADPGNP